MVGRMKLSALAIRKKVFERSSEELLEVEQGDAIHRLLPHELLSLHHPVLRKDFYRRFLDQELIQYSLRVSKKKQRTDDRVSRRQLVDVRDKEIWSKAVTLTLLEIARKQRRLFRSICFSSAETPLQVLDMNPRDRYEVETKTVMDLAEYFPGGGTDFQKPLDAALDCCSSRVLRKVTSFSSPTANVRSIQNGRNSFARKKKTRLLAFFDFDRYGTSVARNTEELATASRRSSS